MKVRKNLDSVNFGKSFGTLVTLIAKWPGISKIYQPLLDYRMLRVLSNNVLVFNSAQGTPCSWHFQWAPDCLPVTRRGTGGEKSHI